MTHYKIEIYRLDIAGSSFSRIAEIESFDNLEFQQNLNNYGIGKFRLDIDDPSATVGVLRRYINQVCIKRNNNIVFFGPITYIDLQADDALGKINVEFSDYLYHFKTRLTDAGYFVENTEASTAYIDLITAVQARTNGELLVTTGTSETIGDVDITSEYEPVSELLIRKSDNQVSFDFDFGVTANGAGLVDGVKFNIYKSKGVFRSNFPVQSFDSNIRELSQNTNEEIYNYIIALGAGTGSDIPTSISQDSASQLSATRRETVLKQSQIKTVAELQEKSDWELLKMKADRYDVYMGFMPGSIEFNDFFVGDTIPLSIKKDGTIIDYSANRRVVGKRVIVNANEELIEPILESN